MLVQRTIVVDVDSCIGCRTCEVACEEVNNFLPGEAAIRLQIIGPMPLGGKLVTTYSPVLCRHCIKAPCKEVCPTQAIERRADGIVLLVEDRCIGCKICMDACPFRALSYDSNRDIVVKCNMCVTRVDQGLEPFCVQHCPGGALRFGTVNELMNVLQREREERVMFALLRDNIRQ